MTSAYEQNRLNLNNSRNIDPNRFKDQMDTVKKFVNPEDPTFISELFLDLKTGYSTFKSAPGGLYIKGGSALGAIGLRRLIKKADIPQKVYTNFNNLDKLTEIGKKIDQPNLAFESGVVNALSQDPDILGSLTKGSNSYNKINEIKARYPITPLNPKVITPKEAKLRNQAMLKEGINVYKDELNMTWKRLGEGRWRNTTARNATRQKIDQITGLPGTRRDSTINYINKRSRDLVASNADEVKHVNSIYNSRDAINQRLNLVKGDRNFMTVEHRIGQSDWKKLGLEGNPHDSANLWLTTTHEAAVKTKIENTLRGKTIKGNYIVDFNPQNNALHVMKLENFKLNELPTGKRFKKNAKGDYNLQEIEKYLTTLK